MNKKAINNIPSIFTIFGITGDLAAKKIIPSLWHLFIHNRLPTHLAIIGFSRRELTSDELRHLIISSLDKHIDTKIDEKDFESFFKIFSYEAGTFEDIESYNSLSKHITEIENNWSICANKLYYLAVPPSAYANIFENLASVKLNIPCGGDLGWSRILIEKPFGTDLASAEKLQALLSLYFKEEQIYRIDHYLFKEIIQGIENFRFSNNLFENTWDNTMIEKIDIRLLESIGVEDRGSFYDSVGALRDVGQNHILTMLAAITSEYPIEMGVSSVRENRALILKALSSWTDESIRKNTFRSQYKGYKNVKGVNPNSTTETYFLLKTELLHPRWKGIPIFMEAGKSTGKSQKEIVLTLKNPQVCLLCEDGKHTPNRIIFRLEPNDEVTINFWTKKPGFDQVIEERVLSFFLYEKETKVQYIEEYAKIIYTAMEGNQTLFISSDEVISSWKFTDPILKGWAENLVPLKEYEPNILLESKNIKTETVNELKKEIAGEIGIIGLGKMGANIARLLHSKNWNVIGYNQEESATKQLESEGIQGAYSLNEFVSKLTVPRSVWLMVPHQAVDAVIDSLIPLLEKGDTIIDGGNSPYKESIRRGIKLSEVGINFLDVGVSGGPGGALEGACTMVGGEPELYKKYENLFRDMSVKDGYGYMGKSGAGHFVKMVHNGIEYGMMQSIAEGFEVLKKSPFSLNMLSITNIYNHGSVVSSSLVGWLSEAFAKFGENLEDEESCSPVVAHSGEGQWTVDAAKELNVSVPIIEGSLEFRKKSKENPSFTGRVLSAMRHQFGGHISNINNKENK
ncbi:MAG: glucose-6-phosphate dehydrogenase [Candidatus Nomurabacteria bacterium]|nr:glucose-6-phosphate dehydrogenase [Candidatus Nomurabacteria bacterium]